MLTFWSVNQPLIALSSGEAELIAMVKASSETIEVVLLLRDWGKDTTGELFVDSSAALGILSRKSYERMREIKA